MTRQPRQPQPLINVECIHCTFIGVTNKASKTKNLIDYGICPICVKIGSLVEKSIDDKNRKKV